MIADVDSVGVKMRVHKTAPTPLLIFSGTITISYGGVTNDVQGRLLFLHQHERRAKDQQGDIPGGLVHVFHFRAVSAFLEGCINTILGLGGEAIPSPIKKLVCGGWL